MKPPTIRPAPTRAKVIPLRQPQNDTPPAPDAPVDARFHHFANINGRRWGR